ncbi:MAG TPA: hypothetical protein DF712_13895 [Balneola sp.]|nr:hypothetical protein [Balneola sp.]|tara:strand:- start:533 stop:730 length:198 start_codon:yes stop_codon:yes gene_type:complete
MDGVELVQKILHIIREQKDTVHEKVTSGNCKDWEAYRSSIGQLQSLAYVEQEIIALVSQKESDDG